MPVRIRPLNSSLILPIASIRPLAFSEKDPLDAAVLVVGPTFDEARAFQAVDQRAERHLSDVQFIGQLRLLKPVIARDEGQHPPLRPGDAERRKFAVETDPAQT